MRRLKPPRPRLPTTTRSASSETPSNASAGWPFSTTASQWTDGATWRGVGYLLLRFPVGLFTFTVAVSAYATALYLIAAPIVAPFDAVDLGFWAPDTWYEGIALVPFGLLLLVISGWVSEGMAAMSRGFARWGVR